eukprot:TRINITY_DN33660_c0_g1_i1.p1 TRINITY_DN33660_c0_g1~~TRINITY_DN33660_c0_g1_i1.p1  ORF type:complete len:1003 (+),score=406.39 TRINITY_DN33660_c0_g1_i1:280-3009(+)
MEDLMRDFLASNELSASSYDLTTCFERWEDFLLTKAPELTQSKLTQPETRRLITAINDLQFSNHKLALIVTDAHPRMQGRLEAPRPISYAEVQRGLSLASIISEEEQVVKNVCIDLDELLEDKERDKVRRGSDSRSDRETIKELTRRLEEAEMRRDNDEMLIRELEDRLEGGQHLRRESTPDTTIQTLAATINDLRATVATMTPRTPAHQFLLTNTSPSRPNLEAELSRLVEVSKYLAVLGPLVPLGDVDQHPPLNDHDEQIARLEREIDLLRERDEQRLSTNSNDALLSELVHEKNSVINRLEDDLRTMERTFRELQEKHEADQEHYDELLDELSAVKQRNKQLHQEIRDIRDGQHGSIEMSLDNEIASLQAENAGLQGQIDTLREEVDRRMGREQELLVEISDLHTQLDAKHDSTGVEDLYEEIYALKEELNKKNDELTLLETEGGAARERELMDEVERLRAEINERDETEFLRDTSVVRPKTANKFVQTDPASAALEKREDSEYMASCISSDVDNEGDNDTIVQLQEKIRDLENRLNESNILIQDYQEREEEEAQRNMDDLEYENEELKEKLNRLEELLDERDAQLQDAYREMHDQDVDIRTATKEATSQHTQQLEEALSRLDTKDEGLLQDLHDLVANLKKRDGDRVEEMQEQLMLQKQNYLLQQQLKDKQHREEIEALKRKAASHHTMGTGTDGGLNNTLPGRQTAAAGTQANNRNDRKKVATVAKRRPKKQKYPFLGLELGALRSEIGGHGGLRVVEVRGPALAAGLQQDDIITEVEGVQITDQNDIKKAIIKHSPQDAVYMKLIRDGTLYEVDVQPEESEIAPGQGAKYTTRVLVKQRPSTYQSPKPVHRDSQTPPYPPMAPPQQHRRPTGKELAAQSQAIFRKFEGVPEPPGNVNELRTRQ